VKTLAWRILTDITCFIAGFRAFIAAQEQNATWDATHMGFLRCCRTLERSNATAAGCTPAARLREVLICILQKADMILFCLARPAITVKAAGAEEDLRSSDKNTCALECRVFQAARTRAHARCHFYVLRLGGKVGGGWTAWLGVLVGLHFLR